MSADIFTITMEGLDAGLRVRDIATYDVQWCDVQEGASKVLGRSDLLGFDFIPVRDEQRVVGVLERNGEGSDQSAGERMRPLDDSLLVSADEPLTSFLPEIASRPYRLVVRTTKIDGIVTRSDVQKLPVRLLAFTLITHLEMTMARVIARAAPDDALLQHLSAGRRMHVEQKRATLHTKNVDPPLVELTEFCDKREILAKLRILGAGTERRQTVGELKRIEETRNTIAHGGEYGSNDPALKEFVRRLEVARAWIAALETRLVANELPTRNH